MTATFKGGEPSLVPATAEHLAAMMPWFPDPDSCRLWAGPDFRFPFTPASFREDARWGELPSYVLVDRDGAVAAFGQHYLRVGRCHVGRLAVAPARRGQGVGEQLVRELCALGCRQLAVAECSLFVMPDNAPAVRLYTRLGFAPAEYPGELPLPGSVYMTAPLAALDGERRGG